MKPSRLLQLACAIALMAGAALAQSPAGSWAASFETQVGIQTYTFEFAIDGTTLTGRAASANGDSPIEEGTVEGNEISFVENLNYQGMPLRIVYTGIFASENGEEIRFTRDVAGLAMEEFVANRPEE